MPRGDGQPWQWRAAGSCPDPPTTHGDVCTSLSTAWFGFCFALFREDKSDTHLMVFQAQRKGDAQQDLQQGLKSGMIPQEAGVPGLFVLFIKANFQK